MSRIDSYLLSRKEKINRALKRLFAKPKHPEIIYQAMSYSVMAGGKRLRPILTLATVESLGTPDDEVLSLACAVELIHTYSLIHDDLPAMDDSDLRRGKPTCHRAFGEAIAVLAGDALLTMAFQLVAEYGVNSGNWRGALEICHSLSRAAGVEGMIGGQVLDLLAEGKNISLAELDQIYCRKTGALIEAAVICGAMAANSSLEQIQALTGYASRLGLAFQIVDDLLDREGSVEKMGKLPNSDEVHCKSTYPALLGLDPTRRKAGELYREALSCLAPLGETGALLRQLAGYLVFRDK
ncbi:MAG TPA: polyprenyl synthetase family protein [Firmicutes bacterium]|nr:polyprenyl synthetase family protein [Bacillota bacterium]